MKPSVKTGVWMAQLALALTICNSCGNENTHTGAQHAAQSDLSAPSIDTISVSQPIAADSTNDDFAIYYITIADTGQNYGPLMKEMYRLRDALHWPVDTMNRHYDRTKNKIVLAEDDEDEMYRGEYFPRRYASAFLSLEYYSTYGANSSGNNVALVGGIFETQASADSMARLLKPHAPNAFTVKASVFVGCIH